MVKYKKCSVITKLWEKHSLFVKFCLVGVTNVGIFYTIYYILLKLDVNYLLANTFACLIAILNGYIWSSKFVFKK